MKKATYLSLTLILSAILGACGDTSEKQTAITYALWDDNQAIAYQELA